MKIAFIHFYTLRLPRGIETLVISLANELADIGHSVSILTARTKNAATSAPISDKVTVKQFPVFRYFEHKSIQPFYANELLVNKYDVAIIFFADFGERALLRVKKKTKTRIVAYWCYDIAQVPHRYQSYRKSGLEAVTSLMLADSRYVAEGAAGYFGREVSVVPVGTDVDYYRPDEEVRKRKRRELGINDSDFVLLNMAALERAKGAHLVIDSLPEVVAHLPGLKYLIFGAGSELDNLQLQANRLGLQEHVRFLGTTSDLFPLYNASDCFILLSEAEANSVAQHEAMSCALPVIVSDTGGAPEVVDSSCGRLVDRGSSSDIAAAIVELGENMSLSRQLGDAARQKICASLTWKQSASKLESHLLGLLGEESTH